MDLAFRPEAAVGYKSASQRARRLTEDWLGREGYCPACELRGLCQHAPNHPAGDFFCAACREQFELKGQTARVGAKPADGALKTMMARLATDAAPNLFVMRYDAQNLAVRDLFLVPKHFLVPDLIEPRKPPAPTARRAGWVGCNIRVGEVPEEGRIALVRDGTPAERGAVREAWRRNLFLREQGAATRGWLVAVMACVSRVDSAEFALADVYAFEDHLRRRFPGNSNIRPKIRQQLQILRDRGRLLFLGKGRYRRA